MPITATGQNKNLRIKSLVQWSRALITGEKRTDLGKGKKKGRKKRVIYAIILSRLVLMLITSDINVLKGAETH